VSVYQAIVDPAERNTSHSLMLELIGPDVSVLDVGCASGYLAEALGRMGCRVSGLEYDPQDAEKARPFLEELVVADLNLVDLAAQFPGRTFDRVVFGDVLEHLLDPQGVLTSAVDLLSADGSVVISIPNVGHGALRLCLLQGHWDYRDVGLLDRTHIRFFTLSNLLALIEQAGLVVTELRSSVADPLQTEIAIDQDRLPPGVVDWVRRQPTAYDYQYILTARRAGDGRAGTDRVVPALVTEPVVDRHTEQARDLQLAQDALADPNTAAGRLAELRHSALTSRDTVIGLEAQLGQLRLRLASVNRELGAVKQDNNRTHAALGSAMDDATHAHAELARSIADSQQAHAQLGRARAENSSVHQRLSDAMEDARQAHLRLGHAQDELVVVHRELDRATRGRARSPLSRLGGKARRAVAGLKRRLR